MVIHTRHGMIMVKSCHGHHEIDHDHGMAVNNYIGADYVIQILTELIRFAHSLDRL